MYTMAYYSYLASKRSDRAIFPHLRIEIPGLTHPALPGSLLPMLQLDGDPI